MNVSKIQTVKREPVQIKFERIEDIGIGGDKKADNAYNIYSSAAPYPDHPVGQMFFADTEGNEFLDAYPDAMYLEYIKLNQSGILRKTLQAIFERFSVDEIVGEMKKI